MSERRLNNHNKWDDPATKRKAFLTKRKPGKRYRAKNKVQVDKGQVDEAGE